MFLCRKKGYDKRGLFKDYEVIQQSKHGDMKTSKVKALPSESRQWTKNRPTLLATGTLYLYYGVPN